MQSGFANTNPQPAMPDSVTKFIIGFVGTTLAFLILPKTIKVVVRRFLLGIVGEVIAVIVAGLLTEKAVDALGKQ